MIATVPDKYTLKNIDTPTAITSEQQYDLYVETLLRLDSQKQVSHEEGSYAKILMGFIEEWDEKNQAIPDASPVEVLATLLEANGLRQRDLAGLLGSESVVSEVLSGKRQLNVGHIRRLSERFHVSPAVFFPKSDAIPASCRRKSSNPHPRRAVHARSR